MKLIHLSDLHLGIRVNGFSMLEDQAYVLQEILQILDSEAPDAVLIAGDIYDRSDPSAEAITLLDDFLVALSRKGLKVFLISGNHDSPERIAFGARLMDASGVHFSPVYNGSLSPVTMEDAYGPLDIWMLPFLKPIHIRQLFPEENILSYTDAVGKAVRGMDIDPTRRNVLLTHQFVTGAARCESEEISVGGTDNVDASVFSPFDYVALGHIHGPQNVGDSGHIRYCGTPLKYSFSEAEQQKSVTVVELKNKGSLFVRTLPLIPKRDLLEIRGTYLEVTNRDFHASFDPSCYLHVTLTDEEDIPDAIGKLRAVYPNIMKLDYDNCRTRTGRFIPEANATEQKSSLELFAEFYETQNGRPFSKEQRDYAASLLAEIQEGES